MFSLSLNPFQAGSDAAFLARLLDLPHCVEKVLEKAKEVCGEQYSTKEKVIAGINSGEMEPGDILGRFGDMFAAEKAYPQQQFPFVTSSSSSRIMPWSMLYRIMPFVSKDVAQSLPVLNRKFHAESRHKSLYEGHLHSLHLSERSHERVFGSVSAEQGVLKRQVAKYTWVKDLGLDYDCETLPACVETLLRVPMHVVEFDVQLCESMALSEHKRIAPIIEETIKRNARTLFDLRLNVVTLLLRNTALPALEALTLGADFCCFVDVRAPAVRHFDFFAVSNDTAWFADESIGRNAGDAWLDADMPFVFDARTLMRSIDHTHPFTCEGLVWRDAQEFLRLLPVPARGDGNSSGDGIFDGKRVFNRLRVQTDVEETADAFDVVEDTLSMFVVRVLEIDLLDPTHTDDWLELEYAVRALIPRFPSILQQQHTHTTLRAVRLSTVELPGQKAFFCNPATEQFLAALNIDINEEENVLEFSIRNAPIDFSRLPDVPEFEPTENFAASDSGSDSDGGGLGDGSSVSNSGWVVSDRWVVSDNGGDMSGASGASGSEGGESDGGGLSDADGSGVVSLDDEENGDGN